RNVLQKSRPAAGFSKMYDRINGNTLSEEIVNNRANASEPLSGAQYLVIAPQSCSALMEIFLHWKAQLGFKTKLAFLEDIGSTTNAIKDYIQNAYDNWDIPPEFVILVGDVSGNYILPSYYIDGYLTAWDVSDLSYSLLDGDDYFPDVLLGRFSIQGEMQLSTIISKIIHYEKTPYMDTDWFKSALMVGLVSTDNGYSQRETLMSIRDKLLDFEYTKVDTFIAPAQFGHVLLENVINSGQSLICYRGAGYVTYWSGGLAGHMLQSSDVLNLSNGFMLPFVTSMTCGGGDFAADNAPSCFGETWLGAGTPSIPKGAIGFIGPSEHDTKTWFNNANASGIYQGITEEGINTCGEMLLRGKMELYNCYPFCHQMGNALDSDQFYFYVYNLLGDPGLRVWTDTPKSVELTASDVYAGSNYLTAFVTTDDDKSGFTVALTNADSLVAVGYTDANGQVNIPIALTEESYELTASKYGYIPQIIDIHVQETDMLTLQDYTFSDKMISGQTIQVDLTIQNPTQVAASDVVIDLVSQDDYIVVTSDSVAVGSIPANQTCSCSFTIKIYEGWQNGKEVDLIVNMNSGFGENCALIPVVIESPEM
ncbi:MAG TPA: C25 family cysteine peptidase, partial [Candidatus Cloacimonadota bacterium]|nr:C25 family cysteine peptidase [Candidatus Cloacimonadota bacterium]